MNADDAASAARVRRWALLRFGLGIAQMAAAVTALLLLVQMGIGPRSLGAVVVTCALTTLSVLLFGARRRG